MVASVVEVLGDVLLIGLPLMISLCIVVSIVAALRAIGGGR
jgi:hypothetical protein